MNAKRILVTGASGFLGSHLCDSLLNQGNYVIGVDNFSTGNRDNLSNKPHFEFVQKDICQPLMSAPVDFVFNFASPASPVDYSRLGIETLLVGSAGTFNTLDIAKRR
jgi:dTDP-glucose 4,6-dehydratase